MCLGFLLLMFLVSLRSKWERIYYLSPCILLLILTVQLSFNAFIYEPILILIRKMCAFIGSKQQECGQMWWKVEGYSVGKASGWVMWASCTDQAPFSQRAEVIFQFRLRCIFPPIVIFFLRSISTTLGTWCCKKLCHE